ncbi:MAG: Crp/Fnr family transcriptional regulator [Lewinella sp.]|jgi:CRP-like cAMP-binding protein|uniref:Crp/Fnr family transcriptional regulator n=1 Tax=Lewinella sp. TaxID=2004506 RepID=UPI003D6BA3B0
MDINADKEQLKAFFNQTVKIREEVWDACLPAWQPFSAKRRTILTTAGDRERYLYFVLDGIQRVFFLTEDGAKEATLVFTYAPSLSGVADSFLGQHPSHFYLETLTESRFLRIPYHAFMEQCLTFSEMNQLSLALAATAFEGVLLRQAELQTAGAEAKFRALLERSPHVLNLIPHKYLASYLGIDPATFSRLLGSVKL